MCFHKRCDTVGTQTASMPASHCMNKRSLAVLGSWSCTYVLRIEAATPVILDKYKHAFKVLTASCTSAKPTGRKRRGVVKPPWTKTNAYRSSTSDTHASPWRRSSVELDVSEACNALEMRSSMSKAPSVRAVLRTVSRSWVCCRFSSKKCVASFSASAYIEREYA